MPISAPELYKGYFHVWANAEVPWSSLNHQDRRGSYVELQVIRENSTNS